MAKLVELAPDEQPPQDTQWVLVTSEGWDGSSPETQIDHHELGATFFAPNREPELSEAIQRALLWADTHAINTIFVQRGRSLGFWAR